MKPQSTNNNNKTDPGEIKDISQDKHEERKKNQKQTTKQNPM